MTTESLNNPPSRRRKFFLVPQDYIISLFSMDRRRDLPLSKVQIARVGLSEEAQVVSAHIDYKTNSFLVVVEDPSFPDVPLGIMMEEIKVDWEVIELDCKQPKDAENPAQEKLPL